MLTLQCKTSTAWVEAVLTDFDAFLIDHAACERKASSTAMTFVAHYPDRDRLGEAMLELAAEELEHFRCLYRVLRDRGLVPAPDTKDAYVGALRHEIRHGPESYLLDRLLVGGIVEARGCERFGLVHAALEPGPLKVLYREITASEARHHALFLELAREYYPADEVGDRLDQLLQAEAEIVARLPVRPALH